MPWTRGLINLNLDEISIRIIEITHITKKLHGTMEAEE